MFTRELPLSRFAVHQLYGVRLQDYCPPARLVLTLFSLQLQLLFWAYPPLQRFTTSVCYQIPLVWFAFFTEIQSNSQLLTDSHLQLVACLTPLITQLLSLKFPVGRACSSALKNQGFLFASLQRKTGYLPCADPSFGPMTVSPVCGVSGLICFTPSDLHQMMYYTSNFRDLHLLFQQSEAFPQTVLWHTWFNFLDHLSPDPPSTFHSWSVPPLKLILYFLPTRFLQVGFVRIHPCCFSQLRRLQL